MLAREKKTALIDQYRTHATDTGSPEVQIAILSERIGDLLDYLRKSDTERYKVVIQKLGIRK